MYVNTFLCWMYTNYAWCRRDERTPVWLLFHRLGNNFSPMDCDWILHSFKKKGSEGDVTRDVGNLFQYSQILCWRRLGICSVVKLSDNDKTMVNIKLRTTHTTSHIELEKVTRWRRRGSWQGGGIAERCRGGLVLVPSLIPSHGNSIVLSSKRFCGAMCSDLKYPLITWIILSNLCPFS